MARIGTSGRAAATYVSLAGLQRGISLLILPFVTHVMSPGEYGAATLLASAAVLLTTVAAAPLNQLIVRAAAKDDDYQRALLRVAGTYCYFVIPIAVAFIAAIVLLLVPEILGVAGSYWVIELLAIGLQPATGTFAMWVARARQDVRRFVWLSSTSVLVTAASKLTFVVALRLGILGWVLSDLLSALVSAAAAISLVRLPRDRANSSHIRDAVRYTVPLVPHSASLWALSSLSRPALAAVSTLDQVGLLSFGLNLSTVAGLVLSESNAALLPNYARETFRAPTSQTIGAVKWQVIGAFVIPALVGCGVAVAGRWIFTEAYWPSFSVCGALLIGQSAFGLYFIPMNYLTQTAGRTRYTSLASGAGAAVILGLILAFGHRYGAVGVAISTSAGYLAMAAAAMVLTSTNKLDIQWNSWRPLWPAFALATAALVFSVAALASATRFALGCSLAGAGVALALGAMLLGFQRR